jgi:thioredoxin reductase
MQADHRSMGILGASPAGLTAVLLAARANLDPLVLQGTVPGGQRITTTPALDSVTTVQTVIAYGEGVRG